MGNENKDIPSELDNIRRRIMSEGYDHHLDYEDLENLFNLADKIRNIKKERK